MQKQNIYNINPEEFWTDPYPDLEIMRREKPIAYVPELNAILFTKRQSIFENEKKIEIFSSDQPDGLMTKLMGENMMRKDGEAHLKERKAIFPSISPKTTKLIWRKKFDEAADEILSILEKKSGGDLVKDYAMPLSAEALKVVTGLTNMKRPEMDRVSQGMIDGIANYSGDPTIERNCKDCTNSIDTHIDEIRGSLLRNPDYSLLSVQMARGLSDEQIRANIKLAISGGQNEPRDAIAGTIWALLKHPNQLNEV
ncbi:MAG: cytochrome P450, partial [Rhodobacteraceae bacterium]